MRRLKAETSTNLDEHWRLLYTKKVEAEIAPAIRLFRSNGIEPMLIKGWAAARNYPAGHFRFFSDVDLSVSASDFNFAERLRTSPEGVKFAIDLHRELRHLDSRPWESIFADSQIAQVNGYGVRIPCEEDHLRIISTHWLIDGGENKEKLWDIYFAVKNRSSEFSWDKCLGETSFNRRSWVICSIGAAHRFLGLEINDLPFAERAKELPEWFVNTIVSEWSSGIPLLDLTSTLRDPREFVRQLRKRLPPNPIRATIETEGDMFSGSVAVRQVKLIGRRARPSIGKVMRVLLPGSK